MRATDLESVVREYEQRLRWAGFDVRQEGVYEVGGWVLLMPLADYLKRLERGEAFGLINLLSKSCENLT